MRAGVRRGIGALLVVALTLLTWPGNWRLPDNWNPWAPLDVRQPPNRITRFKLARLQNDPQLCARALATSSLRFEPQADSKVDKDCPLHNVLRVQGSNVRLSSSFLASCPLAVAFALFERHALQPAAQVTFGQPVVQVDHLGSFACRNVYNRADGRRSQHATANALDIAGVRLADGRRISVLAGWSGKSDEAEFLHQVHSGACKTFSSVLGPDYNAAHRDHFHVDMGGWSVCR
ncbi:extensin family protein [Pseudomonas sp. LS1212]|uniref:extensin-like domain-containing protein n=1 Tax=Pseudomonas sp. LS1212 TaxID=2972478 RepID=UPI00215CF22A|nr:extensin family protein [Pseudomonas sp. LS1212]UVJ45116.1 extensin family protein [Pseudomonas sp. LS1212]